MRVRFKIKKYAKAVNCPKDATKLWGKEGACKVIQRLQELEAAECLAAMYQIPAARFHPLEGNRKGQFAVDARHPFRITMVPDHNPLPLKDDGGLDLTQVKAVVILKVEDYHGRKRR